MRRVRCGGGLGDSIYLRPIAEQLIREGRKVVALSDYPEVFIGSGAAIEPFRRHSVDVVAHYIAGKPNQTTNIWEDICASAKVSAELGFRWKVRNDELVHDLSRRANGRPILLVHGGREPMGRTDGFGLELVPKQQAFALTLDALARECLLVQVGKAKQIYPLRCDLDLTGSTSVADLLDVASVCAGVVAQCSFALPLAEVFNKPALMIWALRGLESKQDFIRLVTPRKMLTKRTSLYVVDNFEAAAIQESARSFFAEL